MSLVDGRELPDGDVGVDPEPMAGKRVHERREEHWVAGRRPLREHGVRQATGFVQVPATVGILPGYAPPGAL